MGTISFRVFPEFDNLTHFNSLLIGQGEGVTRWKGKNWNFKLIEFFIYI